MTIRKTLTTGALFLAGWLAILTGVTVLDGSAPAVLIVFPSHEFLAKIPENAAVLDMSPTSITLVSDDTDFVRRLYQAGATLVLPAGLSGCMLQP
jgi:hypothetical protein